MKQNLVVFSPQNRQKTYNLWKKRIYLYMWEVSYTNKRYIYIHIMNHYSHPIVNPQKSWHPTSESNDQPPLMANKAVPHAASVQVAVSTWLGEPTWISGSIDMSPGGGNLWKSTTIKNKGGSFSKDDKNPTKIRVLRKETLSKKWWQRTSRVTFSPVTRDIHLVYAECSLINMHLEDMKSHLIDSTCKKWTRINT